jgi:3-methyl-2-oxobutanoate hydroxymethyltransferase
LIKFTIQHIKDFKHSRKSFPTITAYDYTSAQIIDEAQIPLILVGDSASMMVYGYDTTIPITMEEMLLLVKSVTRGAKHSLVVADMPFLSYQPSLEETIYNAGLFLKEGGASAVKIEGGAHIAKHVRALVENGIPVLGHVGLTPQSYHQLSGYKIQGKTPGDAQKIIGDAIALQDAGAFGVVLECIPDELAQKITKKLTIPTIGIGSGNKCDGQIQVFHDILGYSASRAPKHAMQYDTMYANVLKSIKKYKSDIENK